MGMKHYVSRAVVFCVFVAACPVFSQGPQSGPQTRPAPGGGGGNSGRPQQPGGGGGGRPGGGGQSPNPGGNRPSPTPRPPQNRPPQNRPPQNRPPQNRPPQRPPQWGQRPPNRPSYNFRPNDRSYLQRYYHRNLGYINRANRPRLIIGGFFPFASIGYITPLPQPLYGYLPPPPPGYIMGYYDGYVVVYDPLTYFIANVVDLLQ